jgi:hypothetical protein
LSSRHTLHTLSSSGVNPNVDLDMLVSVCREFAQSSPRNAVMSRDIVDGCVRTS